MTTNYAEIVTFGLNAGITDEAYLALAKPSQAYIAGCPGFVSRHLSKGDDGTWTDYMVWDNLEHAQAASAGFMAQDFAASMVGAIDPASLVIVHQPILWAPD